MKLAALFGHVKDEFQNKPDSLWVLPECVVGVELEYERIYETLTRNLEINTAGFVNLQMKKYWDLHRDDSLRNNGIEFVSKAVYGKDLTTSLDTLKAYIDYLYSRYGRKPYVSKRCGLHIHVDVRDLSKEELSCFLCLYALYEKLIFAVFGKGRENNNYCLPLYQSITFFKVIKTILDEKQDTTVKKIFDAAFRTENRYSAVNLHSIVKYGSIEFRHSSSTLDINYITDWINVLLSLKKFSLDKNPIQLLEFITQIEFSILSRQIFPEHVFEVFSSIPEYEKKKMMLEGKAAAKLFIGSSTTIDFFTRCEEEYNVVRRSDFQKLSPLFVNYVEKQLADGIVLSPQQWESITNKKHPFHQEVKVSESRKPKVRSAQEEQARTIYMDFAARMEGRLATRVENRLMTELEIDQGPIVHDEGV